MEKFFDVPTQVCFIFDDEVLFGIGYHDQIICACCGGIFEIDEVEVIEIFPDWVNFDEYIR